MAGDRGRADIDRHAERPVVEARPDAGQPAAVVDRHGDLVVARLERGLERPDDVEVGLEPGQAPLGLERIVQPGEVARRRGELGRGHLDVVEPDDRVDLEVADVDALAHDLAMDLALRRHVDQRVAEESSPCSSGGGPRPGR